jgi:hypothetical protein
MADNGNSRASPIKRVGDQGAVFIGLSLAVAYVGVSYGFSYENMVAHTKEIIFAGGAAWMAYLITVNFDQTWADLREDVATFKKALAAYRNRK